MTDRFGPLQVILLADMAEAVGLVFWALAHTEEQALVAVLIIALFRRRGLGTDAARC